MTGSVLNEGRLDGDKQELSILLALCLSSVECSNVVDRLETALREG